MCGHFSRQQQDQNEQPHQVGLAKGNSQGMEEELWNQSKQLHIKPAAKWQDISGWLFYLRRSCKWSILWLHSRCAHWKILLAIAPGKCHAASTLALSRNVVMGVFLHCCNFSAFLVGCLTEASNQFYIELTCCPKEDCLAILGLQTVLRLSMAQAENTHKRKKTSAPTFVHVWPCVFPSVPYLTVWQTILKDSYLKLPAMQWLLYVTVLHHFNNLAWFHKCLLFTMTCFLLLQQMMSPLPKCSSQ